MSQTAYKVNLGSCSMIHSYLLIKWQIFKYVMPDSRPHNIFELHSVVYRGDGSHVFLFISCINSTDGVIKIVLSYKGKYIFGQN